MKKLCPKCKYCFISDNSNVCNRCSGNYNTAQEPLRVCPVDGSNMHKIRNGNIVIDKCPRCRGIWLDSHEIELFENAQTKDKAITALFTGLIKK